MIDTNNNNWPGHKPTRRKLISLLGLLPFAPALVSHAAGKIYGDGDGLPRSSSLPAKGMFTIEGTFLNAAYTHPMSLGSAANIKSYLDYRLANGKAPDTVDEDRNAARAMFAQLINADADEISWVPSTMVGENLVVNALGLAGTKARIVTDACHFDASLYMYSELAKQGAEVVLVMPKNNAINLADMEAAITPGTKLVAISLVSMVNGFQHDVKAICDLAHAKGALVYADIIQAAGAVPIDVHALGVDFCACATYKWLMGDFGAGFLYVRNDRLPLLKRSQFGYRQLAGMQTHLLPFDSPGNPYFEFTQGVKTRHLFEVGTLGNAAVPALLYSLRYLLDTGVDKIQQYRQPMLNMLQEALPKLGYLPMTPEDSTSPIVSFALQGAEKKLAKPLAAARINIQLYENRIRISPSIYNTTDDIGRLIDVLKNIG